MGRRSKEIGPPPRKSTCKSERKKNRKKKEEREPLISPVSLINGNGHKDTLKYSEPQKP